MYMPDPLSAASAASAGLGFASFEAAHEVLSVGVLAFAVLALATAASSVRARMRRRRARAGVAASTRAD